MDSRNASNWRLQRSGRTQGVSGCQIEPGSEIINLRFMTTTCGLYLILITIAFCFAIYYDSFNSKHIVLAWHIIIIVYICPLPFLPMYMKRKFLRKFLMVPIIIVQLGVDNEPTIFFSAFFEIEAILFIVVSGTDFKLSLT